MSCDPTTATEQTPETNHESKELRLSCLAVSRGVGIGRLALLDTKQERCFRIDLQAAQVEAEVKRFRSALETSIVGLRQTIAESAAHHRHSVSDIFGVHLLILESSFSDEIERVIRDQRVNTEFAVMSVAELHHETQSSASEGVFREKSLDIDDVAARLLKVLSVSSGVHTPHANAVVFARELSPSMIVELAAARPADLTQSLRRSVPLWTCLYRR